MNTFFSRLITVVACFFIFSAAWFCLWSISLHLVERPELAALLFPFGLRLGLMLQCPRGYWPVLLGAEWLLVYWLAQEVALTHLPLLMIGSVLTLLPVALTSRYRHQRDWRTLLLQGAGLSRKEILAKYVLLNPYIWLLSLCYVLVYVVRAAINDWGNLYMSETLGVDLVTANTAVSMFELGGFIGALVAGWGSDKLFNGNRGPMNLIFAAGILLSVGSLWLMPFASYVMQAACFFTTGFFVFGPQMLIGMAAAECSHKEAAGAATGFVGLFAYLGASLSGWPLAKVLEIWHWTGFFAVIAIAAGISALLLLPFLNAQAPRETSEA